MPVARFYNIFTKTGCHSAVVVTAHGIFCGILTRECLISSTRDAHRPPSIQRNQSNRERSISSRSLTSNSSNGSKSSDIKRKDTPETPSFASHSGNLSEPAVGALVPGKGEHLMAL